MNPYIEKLKSTLDEISPNLSPGGSVLSLLYEAYSDLHNLDNAQIKADFHDLYQAMSGMELQEMDQILDPVCALSRDHERSGFVEGIKAGMRLSDEITYSADLSSLISGTTNTPDFRKSGVFLAL